MSETIKASTAEPMESSRYRPSILATPFVRGGHGQVLELLSSAEQDALARIAQLMRIKKRTTLYPEGGDARFVYNVIEGVVGTYHLLPGGERLVTAFLFPGDLLGMSENGKYVATAQTISQVVAYRIAIPDLESVLQRDPRLDIGLLTKLCDDIRSAYRHTVDVSKNDASSRVGAFLLWIADIPGVQGLNGNLELPMAWYEIADYLALSTESVSRALQRLETTGIIRRSRPRAISILDHAALVRVAENGSRK